CPLYSDRQRRWRGYLRSGGRQGRPWVFPPTLLSQPLDKPSETVLAHLRFASSDGEACALRAQVVGKESPARGGLTCWVKCQGEAYCLSSSFFD
ncbi:MAG: hypothetical protein J2P37_13645, partial [Ktedonobacteraceae bacterium]|nr:hypothetical protein [Ktedonobacteraceae bacterium]